jgi:hypothetical protein
MRIMAFSIGAAIDAIAARREDVVGVECGLHAVVQPRQRTIGKVIGGGHLVHIGDMAAIFAKAAGGGFFQQMAIELVHARDGFRLVAVVQDQADIVDMAAPDGKAGVIVLAHFFVIGLDLLGIGQRHFAILRQDRGKAEMPAAPAIPVDRLQPHCGGNAGGRFFQRIAAFPNLKFKAPPRRGSNRRRISATCAITLPHRQTG